MAISDAERNLAAQQATNLFQESVFFSKSQHIACYLARTEEFDCAPLIQSIWQANKHCYLPVLSSQEGYLDFAAYHSENKLYLNRFRILEPENTQKISASELDLVLLPLVGFDLKGNRLGVGGGYYDRTFSFLQNQKRVKPLLIGLGFECQQVHQLPYDEWDVQLDGVLTEKKIYKLF